MDIPKKTSQTQYQRLMENSVKNCSQEYQIFIQQKMKKKKKNT